MQAITSGLIIYSVAQQSVCEMHLQVFTDYYSFGMMMPGRTFTVSNSSDYRYSINGQEKEKELNENITSAEFWMYDSRIVRRWNVDPVLNVPESPYVCFMGNPILITDVLGNSGTSTHTDKDGKVIAVFDDKDNGVYKHGDNADGKTPTLYQITKRHQKSKSAGGVKMGETITPLGFADFEEYEKSGNVIRATNAKIDFNSAWATDKINGLLKDNPTLGMYALKAGPSGDYDFKSKVPAGESAQFGSLLFGKYASARDVGNIGAGMVAQSSMMPNKFSDYGFGKYNQVKNSKLKMAWEIFGDFCDFFIPDGTGQAQDGAIQSIRSSIYNGEDKLSRQGIEAGKTLMKVISK